MKPDHVQRIYVRAPSWLGDVVMATPSFARLRSAYPKAEIVCAHRPYLKALLETSGLFDDLIPTSKAGGLKGLLTQARELRARRFDLAVVFPNSIEAGLVPFLARIPKRLGYQQGRPGLMNIGLKAVSNRPWYRRRGPKRIPEPMPDYYARLLDLLEIPAGLAAGGLQVTEGENRWIDDWLREQGIDSAQNLVLFTAGASFGASKLWVEDRFAAVAKHFVDRPDTTPIFLAGPAEIDLVERMATQAGCLAATRPILPLDKLKALAARCSLMISTDTGPRHLAVAFQRPLICLIGPTDPRYTNYALDHTILIRKEMDCSPCQRPVCPLGHHNCMREITVEEVLAAVEKLLPAGDLPAGDLPV